MSMAFKSFRKWTFFFFVMMYLQIKIWIPPNTEMHL